MSQPENPDIIDFASEEKRLLTSLRAKTPGSDEYTDILDQLTKLSKLTAESKPKPISRDTLASIAANLTGILLVINHEQASIITTKAMSMLPKLR